MIQYTIYLESTGQILCTGTTVSEDDILEMLTEGQAYIKTLGSEFQYVTNNTLVDMPERPSNNHIFNYATKQWDFDTERTTLRALYRRDQLLAEGPDRISPVWWNSMTPEKQSEWSAYRQALLDITAQPGYPETIVWPEKPQ
ncbi:phage tail assembly chaperone [Flavobacterium sp.]|jgi:hypothetical protein|uniref:phage tail assembly chaperone n=1 Tax=Flavobacterium sp. TaxID=239 RepID=UPI0037BF895A